MENPESTPLTEALENARALLDDPEDNWYLVAVVPDHLVPGGTSGAFSCWPLRYYEICPGAHCDMPEVTPDLIESIIGYRPVVIVRK